jgi:PAS domain-containing serine/threonine kinase
MASVDLAGSDRLQSRSPEIVTLEKFQGNGMNDVSFAQGFSRGSFLLTSDDPQRPSSALSQSWRFHSFVGNAEIGVLFPTTIRNPNKALVTVDGDTKILIANEMACELFDYTHDRLVGMKLKDLFVSPFQEKQDSLIEEHIDSSGKTIMVNGKVVEAVDSMGAEFPVSMWMKKVVEEPETRCIVVLEPVERKTGLIYLDASGMVVSCDEKFLQLSGYLSKDEICGQPVTDFIPAFHLPKKLDETKNHKEQQATGRTKDGVAFPLSLILRSLREQKIVDGREATYKVLVWVFANISGLISFHPGGKIIGINENYSRLMFGYSASEVRGRDMSFLIPDFFNDVRDHLMESGSIPLPPFESDDTLPPAHQVLQQKMSSGSISLESISSSGKSASSAGVRNDQDELQPETDIKPRDDSGVSSAPLQQQQNNMQGKISPKHKEKEVTFSDQTQLSSNQITLESEPDIPTPETVTSTPAHPIQNTSTLSHSPVLQTLAAHSPHSLSRSSSVTVVEGSYIGYGCHRDGSSLPIVFDVKSVDLDDGRRIYCVWVSRNLVEGGDNSHTQLDWSLGATLETFDIQDEVKFDSKLNKMARI